jgi:hypothetical protein
MHELMSVTVDRLISLHEGGQELNPVPEVITEPSSLGVSII